MFHRRGVIADAVRSARAAADNDAAGGGNSRPADHTSSTADDTAGATGRARDAGGGTANRAHHHRPHRDGDGAATSTRARDNDCGSGTNDSTAAAPAPTPPATPTTTTAGQPAAVSPFQPTPSLNTITTNQIQASQAPSFGNLFFTMPGATSAGLAPGASRPVLRGLDDFRVRVQENGIGSMDVSDLGQDHGVPLDPLSVQKIEILRGPEALRYGSQAVGGVVEGTNNRIPFAAPPGGWQTQILGATTTVDRGVEGGALFDAGSRDFAFHADVYGRHGSDYFIPSYPYLFPTDPAPPFNGKQPNSSFHSEGQAVGGSYLFDGGYVGAAIARFSSLYHVPTMDGAASNTRIALEQVKYTSKGEFRPESSAIDVIRYWAGAVEYHHDELGLGDFNIDGVRATFNNHAQETRAEMQFLPMRTPLGALISTVGAQFDHQQLDTSGDAGSLLGSARTNGAPATSSTSCGSPTRCARCWRAALKTFALTARPASSRRLWCRHRTIRRCHCSRSASRPQASASKYSRICRPGWSPALRCKGSSARPRRSNCSRTARTTRRARSTSAIPD